MKKVFLISAVLYLSFLVIGILLTSVLFPEAEVMQNVNQILVTPGLNHVFGTDTLGRDLFLRVLVGGRVSLLIGLICAILSFCIGFVFGAIAGWYEGFIDKVFMRICEILMAVPSFILVSVLCLFIQAVLPIEDSHVAALVGLCLGISATHWMNLARVTRGLMLEIKRRPFIEAANAIGGSHIHIIWRHILPHMMGTLLILLALQVPTTILYESFMSFIGLGVHPPYTSWGILVREGWKTLSSFPHLVLFPSLVLFLTVWSLHIILDWLGEKTKVH